MEHMTAKRNRLLTTLLTILFSAVLFCCALFANFGFGATAEGGGVRASYKYELKTVSVSFNNDWIFTANTPDSALYRMVRVTVTYTDNDGGEDLTRTLQVTGNKATTGETVAFTRNKTARTVTATVTPSGSDYDPTSQSGTSAAYTLSDPNRVVLSGITAEYHPTAGFETTTATSLDDSFLACLTVRGTYNDGSVNLSGTVDVSRVEGDLFPSALTTAIINGAQTYDKDITVFAEIGEGSDAKTVSTSVLITDIKFARPDDINNRITGTSIPRQVARSKQLNVDGLSISVYYDSGAEATVPLSVFPSDYITYVCKDADDNEVKDAAGKPVLSTSVKKIEITFNYPDVGSTQTRTFNSSVGRISIHTPTFPAGINATSTTVDWNEGATVDITDWDFANLHTDTGDAPAPYIAIDKRNTVTGATTSLSSAELDDMVGDVSGGQVTVTFPSAGFQYIIKVILPEDGDFAWGSPFNGTQSGDNMTMTFTVQVDKGQPKATLAAIADVEYGTSNGSGTLSATIADPASGAEVNMGKTWTEVPASTAANAYATDDNAWHYSLKYYSAYTDATVNTPLTAADLNSDGKPKHVGTYYAVATTYENGGYKSATSDAVAFEVTKYTINTTIPFKTFARTDWTINDFIVPNAGASTFPYGDAALDILSVTDGSGAVTAATKFRHADNYSVTVEIKNDATAKYRNDYQLTGEKLTDTVTFAIKTNEDSAFDFTAQGWLYGTTGADPKINVNSKSATYYPSNTGALATDYTVKYYKYDSTKTDNKGDEVVIATATDREKLEVGRYVIELTANQNMAAGDGKETAAATAGTKVDFTLPVVRKEISVTASPIIAPYLDVTATDWVLTGATAKLLYTYDDGATGKEYELKNWIGDDSANTAADGSAIITVTIKYVTFNTASVETVTGFAGGKFKVNYAGDYTVTITLNNNYSWQQTDGANSLWYPTDDSGNAVYTYSYQGYVAKQRLTVLTDVDITGMTDTYDSASQNKTIGNWNFNALTITTVTVGGLEAGHAPVSGGITVPDDNTPTNARNIFGVTNAGKYTVKVDIADHDNYEWAGATTETDKLRTLTLEYVLNRAAMKVTWSDGFNSFGGTFDKTDDTKYPRYVFDGGKTAQSTPEATVNAYATDNVNLTVDGYTLYKDNAAFDEISSVTAVGYYRIVVSAIGGTAAPNYYLPETSATEITNIATVFEIYAKTIARPVLDGGDGVVITGNDIEVTYRGDGYKLSQFIRDFNDYYFNGVLRLEIELDGNGNDPLCKDVLWNSDKTQVTAYTITVKPADNYAWATGTADETLTYTIKITQKTVAISWGATAHQTTYGEVTQPAPTVNNAEAGDGVTVTLGYEKAGAAVADITKASAGEYTVYAAVLNNLNYKIDDTRSDYSIKFTINKKALAKPTLDKSAFGSAEFNGGATTIGASLYGNAATEQAEWKNGTLFTAAVTAKLDSAWFTDGTTAGAAALTVDTSDTAKYAFDTATGKLTYYAAGVYAVTFTLTDSADYCWLGDGKESAFTDTEAYTCAWDDGLTVNRKVVAAPQLKDMRAMEAGKTYDPLSTIFTGSTDGMTYTVAYGSRDDGGLNNTQATQPDNTVRGQYFVLLTATDKYNYEWVVEPDGADGKSFLKSSFISQIDGKVYKTEYTVADGARVYLLYAVTATQLDVVLTVTDYTYGDNGYAIGDTVIASADKVVLDYTNANGDNKVFDYKNHDAAVTQGDEVIDKLPAHKAPTYTFYKVVGGKRQPTPITDLVEGLPWAAGDYEAEIVIEFDDSEAYQKWADTRSFTVKKREIILEWTFGGETKTDGGKFTATYNGAEQKPTTAVTNLPKKTASETPTAPTLTFAAQAIPNKTAFIDAAEYAIDTVEFSAGDDDNFALGEYLIDFEITPKDVTLTATAQTHTYGDELIFAAGDCLTAQTLAQFYSRDGLAFIVMQVKAGTTVLTDTHGVVYGGTYTLVPAFDGNDGASENYNITTVTAAALTVQKRAITVTVTANPTSVYSEDIADIEYTVALTSGGEGSAFSVDTEADVFTIAAMNGNAAITSKTDVGDYYIVLTINAKRGGNYAITFGTTAAADGATTITHEAYKYSVTAKAIEEDGESIAAQTLTYNGGNQKFLKDGYAVVIGNPEIAANAPVWSYSSDGGATFTEFTQSPTIKNAGSYDFVIKVTAKNHTALTKNITVTVGKAELTVKFDLTIMIGEDDPASIEYMFGLSNLRKANSGWTVTGFVGANGGKADRDLFYNAADSFYNIAGDVKYSVDGYSNTATTAATHAINFIATEAGKPTLTCDNYDFVGEAGVLTVKRVTLVVDINDLSVEYNEQNLSRIPSASTAGVGFTVEMPQSTYVASYNYVPTESFDDIFAVSTTAHDEKVGTSTTGKAGGYAISGTAIFTDKYDVKFVGGWTVAGGKLVASANGTCGKYEITPAALNVKTTIAGYTGEYDEKWHGIIVDGVNTVEQNGDPTDGVVFATASDGTSVAVEYRVSTTQLTVLTKSEFEKLTLSATAPAYRDAGRYYVYFALSNPNYATVLDYRRVVITAADNALKTAFNFQNNSVVLQGATVTTVAWTYGYKVENGFDPDGANAVVEPEATFKYTGESANAVGKITFTLFYNDDSVLTKTVAADAADTVAGMLAELFAGNGLNAGNYMLGVAMEDTRNYNGFTAVYAFRVAKRALTVKAEVPAQIQYGSDVPAFTDNSEGLVVNSSKAGATADDIVTALGAVPTYATVYVKGNTVGDYRVYVSGKANGATDSDSFTNYAVTYEDVMLTVVPRKITVSIADKQNTYNLRGADNFTEQVQTLTFTVTSGSIYTAELVDGTAPANGVFDNDNQTVITLKTAAIVGEGADRNTNNVKFDADGNVTGYTIYAVFCAGVAELNYEVSFADCSNKESADTTAIGNAGTVNNAGSYVITKAIFGVKQYGVFHDVDGVRIDTASTVYSGATNYYVATLDDTAATPITFTYTKKGADGKFAAIAANQVVGVGEYQAIGRSDNPNYTAANLNIVFTITPATLTLTANATAVQFGTTLSGVVATDKAAGGAEESGRFDGFTYGAISPTLLAGTLAAYLNDNVVGYSTVGYTPQTAVSGSSCTITPVCKSDANVNIVAVGATLTIRKREVTVTMVGWDEANKTDPAKHNANAWCYYLGGHDATHNALVLSFNQNVNSYIYVADEKVVFGASGDDRTNLGITVSLPDGVNVGEHEFAFAAANNTNYVVTFTNAANPKFCVSKAKLTLSAHVTQGGVYSYIYGQTIDTLVDRDVNNVGTLTYVVNGMQGNDKFNALLGNRNIVFTITDGKGVAYKAWDSSCGTYTVSLAMREGENEYAPTAATFQNYEIVGVIDASLKLAPRKIKATTQDQTFGFDGTNYNGGLYGKSHNAVITFVDVFGNDANVDAAAYRPSFTLRYDTVKTGNYQAAGAAPTFVGNYNVTVTLGANSNYVFDGGNSCTLKFAVNKLVLREANLGWDTVSYSLDNLDDEKFTNYIERYVDDYFRVVRFVYTSATGDGTQIPAGDKNTLGTYYVENQKMFVTFGREIGTYTISFVLKDSALGNITLDSAIADEINVTFAVSQNKVVMTIQMADFTYGDQPSKVTVLVNGGEATTGLTLTYAPVLSANGAAFAAASKAGLGFEKDDDLEYGDLSNATNFNAGYYVLSAMYRVDDVITRRFYVFYVAKRVITAPQTSIADCTFNGSAQNVVIDYETAYMRPELTTTGGNMTAANGKATFTATAVGTYNVRFILIDPTNNVWDKTGEIGGEFSDDSVGALTLTWKINKDVTANGTEDSPVVEFPTVVDDVVYGGAFNANSITVKAGYNGTVRLYRMPKTDDNVPAVTATGWVAYDTASRAIDAGEYWLLATVTDLTGRNFTDKATVGSFRIVPKTVTASVSGSMIYGTKLSDTRFDELTISGLLYGYRPTIGAYSYDYAQSYANYNAGGAYEIILATDANDEVIGIDAGSNYIVKAARGTLTITKRAVTVTIDGKSSDYSVTPVLTDVQYTAVGLADGEDKSVLGIVFETDATAKSAAGGTYWITVKSYDGTNYVLTQHRALYVINPLEIEVELVRQENITYGDKNIKGATAGEIKIANAAADQAFVKNDLQLVIRFTGSNGYDSFDVPTAAGAYVATLVGASSNYRLIGTPSIDFEIAKKVVDSTAFFIGSAVYTGAPIEPRVDVRQQGTKPMYDKSVYQMTACAFTDAGNHSVTVSLTDHANYVWSSTSDLSITLTFTITKASNKQTADLVIVGWQYGRYDPALNAPSATVLSGENIIYQYSADGKTYTSAVPENGNAGTYYVRVTVAESQNYRAFVGEPVAFEIAKFVVTAPSLTVVTDGNGKNDVYTGSVLASGIVGFNPQLMQIAYAGNIQSLGDSVTVFALYAGTYTVSVTLFNANNYCWSAGDTDGDGTLQLTWVVARKKIAKPTHDSSTKIVNGSTIIYIPIGFDSSVMNIENNAYSYGGTFYAKITLKDTKNYEWATGDDKPFTIKWSIVGSDTVFIAIITVLGVLVVAAAALIVVQILLNKRKKRIAAEAMQAIENADGAKAAEQAPTTAQTEPTSETAEQAAEPAGEQAATTSAAESSEPQTALNAETPTEQPAEKPAEQPADAPTKKPTAKKTSTTKKSGAIQKSPTQKSSGAKKSTATKSTATKSTADKPTAAKKSTTTAKKSTAKKPNATEGGAE
ncbi:MAG: hypothetical protein K2F90_03575 [Clostridiales bacterium]|nr:hypothetical protein [Clostridiales bacterium]